MSILNHEGLIFASIAVAGLALAPVVNELGKRPEPAKTLHLAMAGEASGAAGQVVNPRLRVTFTYPRIAAECVDVDLKRLAKDKQAFCEAEYERGSKPVKMTESWHWTDQNMVAHRTSEKEGKLESAK